MTFSAPPIPAHKSPWVFLPEASRHTGESLPGRTLRFPCRAHVWGEVCGEP